MQLTFYFVVYIIFSFEGLKNEEIACVTSTEYEASYLKFFYIYFTSYFIIREGTFVPMNSLTSFPTN